MDKKRDSMRASTSSNRTTNSIYSKSNKMPIKDSNINMDKKSKQMDRVKELTSEWIANTRQYDPIVRSILMHPELIKTFVQASMNIPVTPWKGVPEPEIIEEESALIGFAKAYAIYPHGIEDDLSFMARVRSKVIEFLSNPPTNIKDCIYIVRC
jgi:hypothetical protein